jgi:hypothetical protein
MALGNRKKEITELKHLLASIRDENKLLQQKLEKSGIREDYAFIGANDLLNMLHMGRSGLWLKTVNTDHYWLSPIAREILGLKADLDVNEGVLKNIILPEDRQVFDKLLQEVLGNCKPGETYGRRCEGIQGYFCKDGLPQGTGRFQSKGINRYHY